MLAISCVAIAIAYGLLIAASYVRYPPRETGYLDTYFTTGGENLFFDPSSYLIYSRGVLASSKQDILIVGASDSVEGFRPDLIQPSCPQWAVHNLASGGSNIEEDILALKLYYEVAPAKPHIVVLGIGYTRFLPSALKYGNLAIPLQREMVRYGFYRSLPGGDLGLSVPTRWQPVFVAMLRPLFWVSHVVATPNALLFSLVQRGGFWLKKLEQEGFAPIRDMLTRIYRFQILGIALDDQRAVAASEVGERKKELLEHYESGMKVKPEAMPATEYERLNDLMTMVTAHGGKLLLVDMPIPLWHAEASAHDRSYHARLPGFLKTLVANTNVRYGSLRDLDRSELFYDGHHPNPSTRPILASRLVDKLHEFGSCNEVRK